MLNSLAIKCHYLVISDHVAAIEHEVQNVIKYSKDTWTSLSKCLTLFTEKEEVHKILMAEFGLPNLYMGIKSSLF